MIEVQFISEEYHNRVSSENTDANHHRSVVSSDNSRMDTLSERLQSARSIEGGGISQKTLGKLVGIPQSHIGNLESGLRHSSTRLPEIAAALGVSAFWLATGKGPRKMSDLDPKAIEVACLYMAASPAAKGAVEFILQRENQASLKATNDQRFDEAEGG